MITHASPRYCLVKHVVQAHAHLTNKGVRRLCESRIMLAVANG